MRPESPSDHSRQAEPRTGVPIGAPGWVTRELIELTIRVWQPYYKALLSAEDALTMILTAGRLFGALSQGSGP